MPLDESPVVSLVASPVGTDDEPFKRNVTDQVFTGNVGLDFKTSDKTLLYLNFSRGFKGSGYNLTFTPDVNVDRVVFQFAPEFMNSYEIGIKMKSSNRYLWNAAAFVTDFRNKQEVVSAGSSVFVSNAESIQGQGIEGEFTGIWNKFFKTEAAFGFLNLRYLDFPFIDPTTLEVIQLSGNRALKAPNFTFKVAPEFQFETDSDLRIMLRLDYNVIGKAYNDIFNTESIARQTAGVLNARLSFSTKDDKYSIALWGKNLTDVVYFQHGWKYTWGEVVSVNPPRMFGLELRANFY